MRLLYFNVIEQNAGWGAEYFMNKALNKIGVETINIDYRENRYNLAKKLLSLNKDFDAVLLQRGENFPKEILEAINRPKFFWASELVSRRRDQDIHFSSGIFEHVFVRGDECKRLILKNGWMKKDKISILLSGFDSDIHKKIEGTKKDIDIAFVGSVTPRRRKILDVLKKKLKIEEYKAYGEELVKIFNRAKIVLNIHAEEHMDTETRVFEALGSGSFLITEKLAPENPFKNGEHLVEVEDIDEMEEKIRHYLSSDKERQMIADSGYREAVSKYSYADRARQITSTMQKYLANEQKNISCFDINKLKEYLNKEKILFLRHGIPDIVKRGLSKIKRRLLK